MATEPGQYLTEDGRGVELREDGQWYEHNDVIEKPEGKLRPAGSAETW